MIKQKTPYQIKKVIRLVLKKRKITIQELRLSFKLEEALNRELSEANK